MATFGGGLTQFLKKDMVWRLVSRENDGFSVEGQFEPINLEEPTLSARYARVRSLGRNLPIQQFEDNELHGYTFIARLWAVHEGLFRSIIPGGLPVNGNQADSIVDQVNTIRNLPFPAEGLGRPRVFDFLVGDVIELQCVVESVGGAKYDRLRPGERDYRGATFPITLLQYEPYDISLTGLAGLNINESTVQPFRENESFESLAKSVYGIPAAGEPLRRQNPDKVNPKVGDLIHMPPVPSLLTGFEFEPQSPTLAPSEEADALRLAHFKRRGVDRISYVLGPLWDEVI